MSVLSRVGRLLLGADVCPTLLTYSVFGSAVSPCFTEFHITARRPIGTAAVTVRLGSPYAAPPCVEADTEGCGLLKRDANGSQSRTHGYSAQPFYNQWRALRSRCHNPHDSRYAYYGGRGIFMAPEWRDSFLAYRAAVAALGPRQPGWTLDRIDNDRGYEPANIHWASNSTRMRNRRSWAGRGHCPRCHPDGVCPKLPPT